MPCSLVFGHPVALTGPQPPVRGSVVDRRHVARVSHGFSLEMKKMHPVAKNRFPCRHGLAWTTAAARIRREQPIQVPCPHVHGTTRAAVEASTNSV